MPADSAVFCAVCATCGGTPAVGMLGGAPTKLATSVALAVTAAMFWDRPILIRLWISSCTLGNGAADRAMHSAWTSSAVALTRFLVLTTAAAMDCSFAAMAAACAPLASWPPMMVPASPAAASEAAPCHWSVRFISWLVCWGTTDPLILVASFV
ncbi:Uncharacterised protein [Mycobacteroides abscessus subsp. abscessus]|nr:Uncharacterised protein [Mycobacteroides abscessus subsp. abscessus]